MLKIGPTMVIDALKKKASTLSSVHYRLLLLLHPEEMKGVIHKFITSGAAVCLYGRGG